MDNSPPVGLTRAVTTWDGAQLLAALRAGARWLEQHADVVNALNVFPVPDGDTGTNLSLTLNGALAQVAPDESCAVVAESVKYWATMRGRGNSGIILSQVLRGLAEGLAGVDTIDGFAFATALARASTVAYQAVIKSVEGTMLTVIREAAAAASGAAGEGAALDGVLAAAAEAAGDAVRRTPTLLQTLRDAGVVDAGGRGLELILEGMRRYTFGEPVELPSRPVAPAAAFADVHGPEDFGYCTNFVIAGADLPFEQIRTTLAAMGESAVVVGDANLVKAHLHTLRPGDALNYAVAFGQLSQIEITNMDLQRASLLNAAAQAPPERDGPLAAVGIVAVAPGHGFAAIFRSLNAGAVVGAQALNPSAAELLAAIEHVPQQQVLVLPNNGNIVLAARQAAQLSDKQVEVIPTRTAPQGIAAMLRFNYQADLAVNARAMLAAAALVSTGEVTRAVRDATIDGVAVQAGHVIGLLDGDLIAADLQADVVINRLLERMNLSEREIVSIYYGGTARREDAERLAGRIKQRFEQLSEVEVQEGGQMLYDYSISAE